MQRFSISPSEMILSAWRHRALIKAMTVREVVGRYRGSLLGLFWSFFHPIFLLLVYTFVFSVVFKARWNSGGDTRTEFAFVLFAGLIVFNLFAECINRAPGLILANVNYVKKVVFPLEILPLVALASALFHALVSLLVWIIAYCLIFGLPHATIILFPFVLAPLAFLVAGLSWFLGSLGVYVRDVSQFIGIITTVLLFLSPVFYPLTALPLEYQWLLMLNPITPTIEQVRAVLYWGSNLDSGLLALSYVIAATVAWLGFAWFQKTRSGFADVL